MTGREIDQLIGIITPIITVIILGMAWWCQRD
jgi:hypothetical protein